MRSWPGKLRYWKLEILAWDTGVSWDTVVRYWLRYWVREILEPWDTGPVRYWWDTSPAARFSIAELHKQFSNCFAKKYSRGIATPNHGTAWPTGLYAAKYNTNWTRGANVRVCTDYIRSVWRVEPSINANTSIDFTLSIHLYRIFLIRL